MPGRSPCASPPSTVAARTLPPRSPSLGARASWRATGEAVGGELDLVLLEGETIAFAEVKTRASLACGTRRGSDEAKVRKLTLAPRLPARARARGSSCRFDVFSVVASEKGVLEVSWLKNAFEAASDDELERPER